MKTVIIDYGAGNIQSIQFAFARLDVSAVLSSDAHEIAAADRVIFPGVGEASSAMSKLKDSGLDTLIPTLKQPVLGICLGMQLMCNQTEEGNTQGLGIFDVNVKRFTSAVKVPQMGWNALDQMQGSFFKGVPNNAYVYLVHSYYAPLCNQTVAQTQYEIPYSAALQKDNFMGVQFHPEKSGTVGAQLLTNFLNQS